MTLADAEASTKEVADWAGLTDLQKLRRASTETIFAMGTLYSSATGKRSVLTASPISPYIDGYVLTEGFDEACVDGTLADVPYMIGYTLNDAGNMEPVITDFCLNREENGGKAWAYQFARPLPTDGRPNVLQGAFHSSDLWFVFKSLKNCWRAGRLGPLREDAHRLVQLRQVQRSQRQRRRRLETRHRRPEGLYGVLPG